MRVLLFVGAGASVDLGVPAMRRMLEEFRDYLREQSAPDAAVSDITSRLQAGDYDIEQLVDDLDNISRGRAAMARWGADSAAAVTKRVEVIRPEAEWFIQHVCERVKPSQAASLWAGTVEAAEPHALAIVTTNYDRAVEYGFRARQRRLEDGFPEFGEAEWVEWSGFTSLGGTVLIKLHGSTDWYHAPDVDRVIKLRHPMPLYGRLTITVEGLAELRLGSALVLPAREKKTIQAPYPDLMFAFQQVAQSADIAIFLGTSLRDPDLRQVAQKCAARVPTFVVSRNAEKTVERLHGRATAVRQSAVQFLVSTLPTALRGSPAESLAAAACHANGGGLVELGGSEQEVIGALATIREPSARAEHRCRAIERLADLRVALSAQDLGSLLEDPDEGVRVFALGLVRDSHDRDALMERVRTLAGATPDCAFAREAELLERLLHPSAPAGRPRDEG